VRVEVGFSVWGGVFAHLAGGGRALARNTIDR